MAGELDNRNSISNTAKAKIEAIHKFRKFSSILIRIMVADAQYL
jgi:hypothetical protein